MLARRLRFAGICRAARAGAAGGGRGARAAQAPARAEGRGRGVRYRLYMVSRIESIGCLGLRGTALVDSGAPSRSIV
jgi:hypothetical protein